MTRRDMCHLIGKRAAKLSRSQAARAWLFLARHCEDDLAGKDVPKFIDLSRAIRAATIFAKKGGATRP